MSIDVLGIAVGVVFGVMAALPVAVLILAAGNRQQRHPPRARIDTADMPYRVVETRGIEMEER